MIKLERLLLQGNRICMIEGLETLVNLGCLDLEHNHIKKIENIEYFVNLDSLYLIGNPLEEISRASLEFVMANNITVSMDGKISDLKVVD